MANSKRKCKYHGEHTRNYIVVNNMAFCTFEFAVLWANENKSIGANKIKKEENKKYRDRKTLFRLSDKKTRKQQAVFYCHKYIRERDKYKGCITCNRPLTKGFHAGHFLSAGNHSFTKFMEKNIHGQCIYCNTFNGGKEKEYKEALIEKYGYLTVKALDKLKSKKIVRSAEDYLKIEKFYKNKLKMLELNFK